MTDDQVSFNINDQVGLRITPVGRRLYEAAWRKYNLEPLALKPDPEGFVWMGLWQAMNYFGPGCHMGFNLPIETTIRLKKEDIES